MKIKYLCLDEFNGMLFIEVYIYNGLNKKCIKKKISKDKTIIYNIELRKWEKHKLKK